MSSLSCVGCGGPVHQGRLVAGNRFRCENCAGLTIEVFDHQRKLALRQVHFASCAVCDAELEVPAGAAAGETMSQCGRTLRLTYAFGGYALE